MSIFNRDKSPSSSVPTPRPRPAERQGPEVKASGSSQATYIAAGSRVTGEISGSAEVLVDGEFDGKLHLENTVVIGEEGRVRGEVVARSVRVEGRVVGDVRGKEKVEVMTSGHLEGDISAARVVIAEGAFFKGNVEMTGKDSGQSKSPGGQGGRDKSHKNKKGQPNSGGGQGGQVSFQQPDKSPAAAGDSRQK